MDRETEQRLEWVLGRIRHVRGLAVTLHAKDVVVEAGRLELLIRSVEEAQAALRKVLGMEQRSVRKGVEEEVDRSVVSDDALVT